MIDQIKRAEELYAVGKKTEAKFLLMSVLEQDSDNAEAHNNLGVILYTEKSTEDGLFHLQKAITLDPFYRDAIINYAEILTSMDQLQKAVPMLKKYTSEHPDDSEMRMLLEEALKQQADRLSG